MRKHFLSLFTFCLLLLVATGARADESWELSVLYSPSSKYDYNAEGNNSPPAYTSDYSGMHQRMDGIEAIKTYSDTSRLGISYIAGGTSQFYDEYGIERVEDYQMSKLNVGFASFMLTHYKKIADSDLEFMINFGVIRQFFSRKDFEIGGEVYPKDDDSEISGEGIGFGIRGKSGRDLFIKYKAFSNFYIQNHDMKTDKELGEYFNCEVSAGYQYKKAALEFGYMYQYIFMHSQTNRRVYLGEDDAEGAIISWSQQDMTVKGPFFRFNVIFD